MFSSKKGDFAGFLKNKKGDFAGKPENKKRGNPHVLPK